jgi:hypothetical protein
MKIRIEGRIIAALVLVSASTPAAAQATNDVRCLMASNLFAKGATDPKARRFAESAKFFYLGRISGRLNEQQVRAQMLAQQKTITPANAGNVMTACARQMQSGAAMVERVGKQLAPREK